MTETKLSRRAELVAVSLFGFGIKSSVTFRTPSRISPEAMEGIQELLAAGMIEPVPAMELPRDAAGWKGTEKIGFPMTDIRRPDEHDENFPLIQDGK